MGKIDKKVKIIVSVISVLIAVALIGGATFAWLSISRAPRIKELSVKVPGDGILEIALSEGSQFETATSGDAIQATGPDEVGTNDLAKGQTTWGSEVTLGEESQVRLQAPASVHASGESGENKLSTIKYENDARTSGFVPLNRGEVDENGMIHYTAETVPGQKYITPEGHIETAAQVLPVTAAGGAAVWIRSNTDAEVNASLNGIQVISGSLSDTTASASGSFEDVPVGICLKVWHLEPDSGGVPKGRAQGTLEELGTIEITGIDTSVRSKNAETEVFSEDSGIGAMEAGQIYLVEILSYVEGDREKNPGAVIAKTVGERTITIGIEDVSFHIPDEDNN